MSLSICMNKFAERLKELREEKGLTQSELGRLSGIGQSTIARWETGERSPIIDSIIVLSKFFEVSSDYLIGLTDF